MIISAKQCRLSNEFTFFELGTRAETGSGPLGVPDVILHAEAGAKYKMRLIKATKRADSNLLPLFAWLAFVLFDYAKTQTKGTCKIYHADKR